MLIIRFARKVARHTPTFLLVGRRERGKELVARPSIRSVREPAATGVCNCSAMVDTLLESQLFGHVRGAFTGATIRGRIVRVCQRAGTVFLDEWRNFAADAGRKLLRVSQNREIQRVGSPEVSTSTSG